MDSCRVNKRGTRSSKGKPSFCGPHNLWPGYELHCLKYCAVEEDKRANHWHDIPIKHHIQNSLFNSAILWYMLYTSSEIYTYYTLKCSTIFKMDRLCESRSKNISPRGVASVTLL